MSKEINNNIEEPYCSFEISQLLKQKGFHWANQHPLTEKLPNGIKLEPNDGYYSCYNEEGKIINPKFYNFNNSHYPRPTHALAIEWIRVNFGFD